jgi:hypothetical protein
LQRLYLQPLNHGTKIIKRDSNTQLGTEQCFASNVTEYILHGETTDSIYSLTDLAMAGSMVINSILFQQKSIHLQTCRSPGGLSVNQTDHIIINSHHATDITDFKSCMVVNCDSVGCEERDASNNTGLEPQEQQNDKTM